MIARRWRGAVPGAKGEAYLELMRSVALPDYASTSGNRGAWCLYRTDDSRTVVQMLTFWDDIDAVKRLAGDDYARAKCYDFDPGYLVEETAEVRHYRVFASAGGVGTGHKRLIARQWEGKVASADGDDYAHYLAGFGLDDYRVYPGACGAWLLREDGEEHASFILLSFWTSREAISSYAGSDIERARYYPYDLERLIDPPVYVQHYDAISA